MDGTAEELEKYLARLEVEGQKLPGIGRTGKPHFGAISVASGVDYKFLTTEPVKRLISVSAETLGVECLPKLRGEKLLEQSSSLIANYLKWLEEHGLTLPENPMRRGEIFFRQVEIESGLGFSTLIPKNPKADNSGGVRLREMLQASISHLSLGVRILPQFLGHVVTPITYEQLLERGTDERRLELSDKPSANPQLYNTRFALRSFCKASGLEVTAIVGREFVADFKKSVEEVISQLRNIGSRRKFQTEIRWWFNFYQRLVKEQALPESFHETLVQLIDRSGLPVFIFSKLVGAHDSTLSQWYKGRKSPSVHNLPIVSRIELLCQLPAGTLVNKLRRSDLGWRIKPSQLPDSLRGNKNLASRVCPHLPDDFCELPPERQREIFESVRTRFLGGGDDPHARMVAELQKLPYRLTQWSASLEDEFSRLASFKTGSRPPIGMRRNGQWKPATRDKILDEFGFFFGALSLPRDAGDARMRGLGVPTPDLTIALIACPLVVDWYIRFRCEVRSSYTTWPIGLLQHLRSMLAAGTGWLRQQPQLASRLRPISCDQAELLSCEHTELVSPELIKQARKDWDGVCDAAADYYKHLLKELKSLIALGRDPFRRIEGVVEMDDPMQVFPILIRGMRREMPNPNTRPTHYHIAVRNCVLGILIALTGMRRGTVSRLDYTGDDTGHLTLRDGRYVLRVPPALFKNEDSSFFGPKNGKKDYVMELPEALGVTATLSEYLNVSRPFLLSKYHPGCEEQPLFVTARSTTARIPPAQVSNIYAIATERHLAENEWRGTGFAKVRRHSAQCVRHTRGTAVVKKTGSFQLAADANQHTERTARTHYARFAPEDRNRRVNSILYPEERWNGDSHTHKTIREHGEVTQE